MLLLLWVDMATSAQIKLQYLPTLGKYYYLVL